MSGCNNDDVENTNSELGQKTLMTMQITGPQTRADYTDNGTFMSFSWRNNDAISVVVDGVNGNENCQFTTSTDGKNSPFQGTVTSWNGTKNVYAIYPYSATGYTVNSGENSATATTSLTLPNPQLYTVGGAISNSFMVGAGTATASGSTINASASLRQVMSIIKLNISNAPAKVIKVKLKCSEPVFPTTATVKLSDGTISSPGTLVNELSMTVTDGTSNADKSVSFAMFPANLTGKTIAVDVTFEGGLIKTINKAGLSFARNSHYIFAFDATGADPVIELNGLKWATGNLIANGANDLMIGTPTDRGLFFQFGSLLGWSENGDPAIVVRPADYSGSTSWNSTWTGNAATENTATGTGDPCKYYLGGGWRLPTMHEYYKLFDYTLTSWAGTIGWSWASTPPSAVHTSGLTFPVSGYRHESSGILLDENSFGYAWSSSLTVTNQGHYMGFGANYVTGSAQGSRAFGNPVRCVRN